MKSICNIISLVSSGKFVKNKIWLGGPSKTGEPAGAGAGTGTPIALEGGTLAGTTPSVAFFFFFLASSGPAPMRFGLSWKVPFSLAITSESDLERRRRLLLNGV